MNQNGPNLMRLLRKITGARQDSLVMGNSFAALTRNILTETLDEMRRLKADMDGNEEDIIVEDVEEDEDGVGDDAGFLLDGIAEEQEAGALRDHIECSSLLKKRRRKMRRHKHKKRLRKNRYKTRI